MSHPSDMSELVVAVVRAPMGLSGDLALTSCSGENGHLLPLSGTDIDARNVAGLRVRLHVDEMTETPRGLIVHFSGFDDPEKASTLTGAEIILPRERAAPLGPEEYYVCDLVGSVLWHREKGGEVRELGTVNAFIEGGGGLLLEARLQGDRLQLIPFRKEFVGRVDQAARRVELIDLDILE